MLIVKSCVTTTTTTTTMTTIIMIEIIIITTIMKSSSHHTFKVTNQIQSNEMLNDTGYGNAKFYKIY